MSLENIVFLLFTAIVIIILSVMQYRRQSMHIINFFAGVIIIATITGLMFTKITLGWYILVIIIIFLTMGAMIANR